MVLFAAPLLARGSCRTAGEGLLIRADSGSMRGNGFERKEGRFRAEIGRKGFTVSVRDGPIQARSNLCCYSKG